MKTNLVLSLLFLFAACFLFIDVTEAINSGRAYPPESLSVASFAVIVALATVYQTLSNFLNRNAEGEEENDDF